MALIYEGVNCPICYGILDRPWTATSGVVFPPGHALYEYCDAPLHLDCLESWPYRVQFSEGYFNLRVKIAGARPGHLLHQTRDWEVTTWLVTEEPFPHRASIYLRTWPFPLSSGWHEWNYFVAGEFRADLVGGALAAPEQVMAEVVKVAPNLNALNQLLAITRMLGQEGN